MSKRLHFGKYDGMDMFEVAQLDPEYVIWAADNIEGSGITQNIVDTAISSLERGEHWDYDSYDDYLEVANLDVTDYLTERSYE